MARGAGGALLIAAAVMPALAQTLPLGGGEPPAPSRPAPDSDRFGPREGQTVFDTIGRFFGDGALKIQSDLQSAKERADALNEQAEANRRDALAATKAKLDEIGRRRAVRGREVCDTAPNGAPDCDAAALRLCQRSGFTSGSSMDSTSAEKCPARALLAGREAAKSQCTIETFISQAMCQ